MNIHYLGPKDITYSSLAARKFAERHDVNELIPEKTHPRVAEMASKGALGVLAYNNIRTGWVQVCLDLILRRNLHIVDAQAVAVEWHLGRGGDEKRIYSHEQGLLQCEEWISEHYPEYENIPVESTGKAAWLAREQGGLALCRKEAIESAGIEELGSVDIGENYTCFYLVGAEPRDCYNERTLIAVDAHFDTPGLLERMILHPLSSRGINLCKILSRPSRRNGNEPQLFYIEMDTTNGNFMEAVDEVKQVGSVTVMGSYPDPRKHL